MSLSLSLSLSLLDWTGCERHRVRTCDQPDSPGEDSGSGQGGDALLQERCLHHETEQQDCCP